MNVAVILFVQFFLVGKEVFTELAAGRLNLNHPPTPSRFFGILYNIISFICKKQLTVALRCEPIASGGRLVCKQDRRAGEL